MDDAVKTPRAAEKIEKNLLRIEELGQALKNARDAREAREISRELAKLSKEVEIVSRAVRDYDKAMSATG